MILQICAVRDRAIDAFGRPMFVAATGQAVRSFGDAINGKADKDDTLASHPEDFDLYHLGTYDDATALFVLLANPRVLAIGKDVKISA